MDEEKSDVKKVPATKEDLLVRKLRMIGWGALLIWLGLAFLFEARLGVTLVGTGMVIIGAQIARKVYKIFMEGFWVGIGIMLTAAGIWELFDVSLPLLPLILITAGIIFILRVSMGDKLKKAR